MKTWSWSLIPVLSLVMITHAFGENRRPEAQEAPQANLIEKVEVEPGKSAPIPGHIQLIQGYKHEPLQGIDSRVGRISRNDGFTINYEQGRVPKENEQFRLGGDFSNAAQHVKKTEGAWYREQTVQGTPMQIAMTKEKLLVVTFPESGINFTTKIEKDTDLAEVLLMLLTFDASRA
ncbi:MAG: hypothetical protein R3C01_11880 [Planctomycetaceae bacterium]